MQITGYERLRTLLNWVMARTNSTHVKFIESCVRDFVLWIRSIWRKKWLICIWTEMRECVQHVMLPYPSSPLFKAFCKSKMRCCWNLRLDLWLPSEMAVLSAECWYAEVKAHSESITWDRKISQPPRMSLWDYNLLYFAIYSILRTPPLDVSHTDQDPISLVVLWDIQQISELLLLTGGEVVVFLFQGGGEGIEISFKLKARWLEPLLVFMWERSGFPFHSG